MSKEWYGNKISSYGEENGYVDYMTFAKAFNHVLNNDIMTNTAEIGFWDIVSGWNDEADEWGECGLPECFMFFIVDENGAELCKEFNEVLFYNDVLDMYVWGVTHYGTAWDYVLTDIKITW